MLRGAVSRTGLNDLYAACFRRASRWRLSSLRLAAQEKSSCSHESILAKAVSFALEVWCNSLISALPARWSHHETQARQIRIHHSYRRRHDAVIGQAVDRTARTGEINSGTIELAMNRIVAERLHSAVVKFLQAGEGDDAPTLAVERSQ